MFTYFHSHKNHYNKGQVIPLFIAILVVILIMAIVTVNLSKVAFFKTETANSVDAGSLASGSVMANVFNGVAVANSGMETAYWEFLASVSVSFAIALYNLITAHVEAQTAVGLATAVTPPWEPCVGEGAIIKAIASLAVATASMTKFIIGASAIMISIIAFSAAQGYTYASIRKMAAKGRLSAFMIGHQLAFANSGVGSKLKSGFPDEGLAALEKNNYRKTFSKWTKDNIKESDGEVKLYAWLDGQKRGHSFRTQLWTDPLETYDLTVTLLPLPVEVMLMGATIALAISSRTAMLAAQPSYDGALIILAVACICVNIPVYGWIVCRAAWYAVGAVPTGALIAKGTAEIQGAITIMWPIYGLIAAAWAGLLPGMTITDSSGGPGIGFLYIICWIQDIVHNRKVNMETFQSNADNAGTSLSTLSNTTYNYQDYKGLKGIASKSIVDFRGKGSIYPPKPRHDASIIVTDTIEQSLDDPDPNKDCNYQKERVCQLERQNISLGESIRSYYDQVAELDAQVLQLNIDLAKIIDPFAYTNMVDVINRLIAQAVRLREEAIRMENDILKNQAKIEKIKADYSHCTFGACV